MAIVTCTACQKKLKVADASIGKKVKCSCGTIFVAQADAPAPPKPAAAAGPEKVVVACTECGAKLKVATTSLGKKMKCPKCASVFVASIPGEAAPVAKAPPLTDEDAPKPSAKNDVEEDMFAFAQAEAETVAKGDDEDAPKAKADDDFVEEDSPPAKAPPVLAAADDDEDDSPKNKKGKPPVVAAVDDDDEDEPKAKGKKADPDDEEETPKKKPPRPYAGKEGDAPKKYPSQTFLNILVFMMLFLYLGIVGMYLWTLEDPHFRKDLVDLGLMPEEGFSIGKRIQPAKDINKVRDKGADAKDKTDGKDKLDAPNKDAKDKTDGKDADVKDGQPKDTKIEKDAPTDGKDKDGKDSPKDTKFDGKDGKDKDGKDGKDKDAKDKDAKDKDGKEAGKVNPPEAADPRVAARQKVERDWLNAYRKTPQKAPAAAVLEPHSNAVAIDFAAQAPILAVVDRAKEKEDADIKVWNLAEAKVARSIPAAIHTDRALVAVSPDGELVALFGDTNPFGQGLELKVFKAADGAEVKSNSWNVAIPFNREPMALRFTSDGKRLTVLIRDQAKGFDAISWDTADWAERAWDCASKFGHAFFSQSGDLLYECSNESRAITVREIATEKTRTIKMKDTLNFADRVTADDKHYLYTKGGPFFDRLQLVDLTTGEDREIARERNEPFNVHFSPDGRYVLYGARKADTKLMELATGKVVWTTSGAPALAFSPGGLFLARREPSSVHLLAVEDQVAK